MWSLVVQCFINTVALGDDVLMLMVCPCSCRRARYLEGVGYDFDGLFVTTGEVESTTDVNIVGGGVRWRVSVEVGVRPICIAVRTRAPLTGRFAADVAPRVAETIRKATTRLRVAAVIPVVGRVIVSYLAIPIAQVAMRPAARVPSATVAAHRHLHRTATPYYDRIVIAVQFAHTCREACSLY